MGREHAIARAWAGFDQGDFARSLARRVAHATESQAPDSLPRLEAYLTQEMVPSLQALGFETRIVANPVPGRGPFLLARRMEPEAEFTLLSYGHGDVVRGQAGQWRDGRDPWTLARCGDRWYGRGTADNKGQHSIQLAALDAVLHERQGRLGYNVKWVLEMGEEVNSPGLQALCAQEAAWLAADVFIASDGPRTAAARPTVFLGGRGYVNFDLVLAPREGAHHSGNWGGLLSNPAIRLAHALASLVDARGRILVEGLRPPALSPALRAQLAGIRVGQDAGDPAMDPGWGEPGLQPAEQLYAWNALEVLAWECGNPQAPLHAVPAAARVCCHLRFVPGTDRAQLEQHLRQHLDAQGFADVGLVLRGQGSPASRLDPQDPWVDWLRHAIARTAAAPDILPNLGGSLPNHVFAETLGLPTLWIPHSYPGCSQHAPDEHLLAPLAREALGIMAGVLWDLGDSGSEPVRARQRQILEASAHPEGVGATC